MSKKNKNKKPQKQPQVQQVQQPVQQPIQQPQPIKISKNNNKQKTTQQLQRAPQQVVKDYIPLYKKPNSQPIIDSSIATYLNQFKKVYKHFTQKNDVPHKLKNELIKVLQLKHMIINM